MWPFYAFYRFMTDDVWGIVIMNILVRRNIAREWRNQGVSYRQSRMIGYNPRIVIYYSKARCLLLSISHCGLWAPHHENETRSQRGAHYLSLIARFGLASRVMDERCKYWQIHQIVTSNKLVSLSSPQILLFNSVIIGTYLKVNKSKENKRVAGLNYPVQYEIKLVWFRCVTTIRESLNPLHLCWN